MEARLKFRWAAAIVLFLWLPYTIIEAFFQLNRLGQGMTLILELIPGIGGLFALLASGLSLGQCFCRWRKASRMGLTLLTLLFILTLPILFKGR